VKEHRRHPEAPFRVLVFPGGTEIGLEVRQSLMGLKEVRLAGAGSPADRHGPFAYRQWAIVDDVHQPGWMAGLGQAIRELEIDFIVPGHDDALLALAENAHAIPARIITSPLETCRITRSKRATYSLLADCLPVPRLYREPEEVDTFPVFAKPDRSQGSQGAVLVHDRAQLAAAHAAGSDLVLEYLPGTELTVDCFSDRDRGVLFARARPRVRTRAGISMSSGTMAPNGLVSQYAEAIASQLDLHGAWFFQLREDANGTLRLLEVAPRIAGTSAVHRVTGVNFALLSLYENMRMPITLAQNRVNVELDRALTNRYQHDLRYDSVYVDLDDTLIVQGRVHTGLVAFLYQCRNEDHRLVLLTRHRADLAWTLARFRLTELWDEVVRVPDDAEKADFITERNAILIDDSFRERRTASERLGIATFDSSMLELLRDDRA
jgi:hypothetical protein